MRWFILLFAVACIPSSADGGVSFIKSERIVAAAINNGDVEPPLSAFEHATTQIGAFNKTAEAHVSNEFLDHSDLTTSQNSRIGGGSVVARGDFFVSSSDDALYFYNTIDATFRVTEPIRYQLGVHFQFSQFQGSGRLEPFIVLNLQDLTRSKEVVRETYEDWPSGLYNPMNVNRNGVLSPGDYRLQFLMHDEVEISENIGNYQLNFQTGNAATAVPLPSAVAAGVLVLPVLAGAIWFSRRKTAWQ